MAYFVFRINYENYFNEIRKSLISNGKLRQGWGAAGMNLNPDFDSFRKAWDEQWGPEPENEQQRRYDNLCIMKEIEIGDYVIIPKISMNEEYVCRSFIIAKCKQTYQFEVLEDVNDFGHYIVVDELFSCSYDYDMNTEIIKSKFRAYQSPLNRVYNENFINAVNNLINEYQKNPTGFEKVTIDLMEKVHTATRDSRNAYLKNIVSALQNIAPDKFEKLIAELFEKNGYSLVGNNWYDKKGGDIDLYFESFNKNTLLYNIFEICESKMPHIYVQAKKKTGIDVEDVVGVNQLIQMEKRIREKNSILMVINLADSFTVEAKTLAKEKGIVLINGSTFASLLVRYGIEVEINE